MQYKVLLMVLLMIVVGSTWAQTQTKQFRVNFNVDEHTLDKSDEVILNELLLLCKQATYAEIKLTAHTDIDADDQYNLALSKRRAQSVTAYLDANQLNTKNIRVNWYGERKPEASNDNDEGKAMNRRVDIAVTTYQINNTSELLKSVSPEYTQTFTINPKQDNTIKGRNGTSITIPKGTLVNKNGKPIDANAVQITLKEFLKPQDAAFNQLSTISNGKLLESGGMFTVEATANGEPVNVKKGQTMQVQMPTINMRNNMQLFTAVKNAQGISEWKPTNVPFRPAIEGPRSTPFVNLNTKKLKTLLVENKTPEAYAQFEYKLPAIPIKPEDIGEAPKYKEPTLQSEFNWWQRFFFPDSWLQQKLDVVIARKQKQFDKQMAKYQAKKAIYDPALAKYQIDSARFEQEELANLRCWLSDQKEAHQQYAIYKEKEQWNNAIHNLIYLSNANALTRVDFKDRFLRELDPTYNVYGNRFVHSIALSTIAQVEGKSMHHIVQHWAKDSILHVSVLSRNSAHYLKIQNNFVNEKKVEQQEVLAMLDGARKELIAKQDEAKLFDESRVGNVYATSLSGFGSFNCDRFSETPPNRMAKVTVPYQGEARVSFFVPSINSYIYAEHDKDGYYTSIPKDMEVKVVFVSFSKTDGPVIDIKTTRFTKNTKIELHPKSVTLAEMEQKLASL
jgi:hypothetical protein